MPLRQFLLSVPIPLPLTVAAGVVLGVALVLGALCLVCRCATALVRGFTEFRRTFREARISGREEGWGAAGPPDQRP